MRSNDTASLLSYLRKNKPGKVVDPVTGDTLMHAAAAAGHHECMSILQKDGFSLLARENREGVTPVHILVKKEDIVGLNEFVLTAPRNRLKTFRKIYADSLLELALHTENSNLVDIILQNLTFFARSHSPQCSVTTLHWWVMNCAKLNFSVTSPI